MGRIIRWLGLSKLAALVAVIGIALVVLLAASANGATLSTNASATCSKTHRTGYWHASCVIQSPKSFHIFGDAFLAYSINWGLSCEGRPGGVFKKSSISLPMTYYAKHFNITVDEMHYPAVNRMMLTSTKCTLSVTFRQTRASERRHLINLEGAVTINRLPRLHIHD